MGAKRFTKREEVIEYISSGGKLAHKICEYFQADLDCIKSDVRKKNGTQFDERIMDGELLIELLRQEVAVNLHSWKCRQLLKDYNTALAALQLENVSEIIPYEFLGDPLIAKSIINRHPFSVCLLSFQQRNDASLMIDLKTCYRYLGYALRSDPTFMLNLCIKDAEAIEVLGENLLQDRNFCLRLFSDIKPIKRRNGLVVDLGLTAPFIFSLAHIFRDDDELASLVVAFFGFNYQCLSPRLKQNLPLLLTAVEGAVKNQASHDQFDRWGIPYEYPKYDDEVDEGDRAYGIRLANHVKGLIIAREAERLASVLPEKPEVSIKKMKISTICIKLTTSSYYIG